jgi:hypothetical protein
MINVLAYIIVIALLIGLAYWIIDVIPIPQPINRFAKIAIVIVGVIALIYAVLSITGQAPRLLP